MSRVRTPMRLLERPMRTLPFGSFSSSKNDRTAPASALSSRTSPSTTMPAASGRRARPSSSWPRSVSVTTAAASCEAPIFSPTTLRPLPLWRLGAFSDLRLRDPKRPGAARCVVGSHIRKIGDGIRVGRRPRRRDGGRHGTLVVVLGGNVLGRGDVLECGDVVERGHILEGSDVVLRLLRGILRAPRVVGGAG